MAILQDPVMQSILQQAKGDPAALQDHMKNPGIRAKVRDPQALDVARINSAKIQKLVVAGVIRTR